MIGQCAADEFRLEYGLGTDPIENIARLIEVELGAWVAYVRTSNPGHGMTMRLGDRYLMAVGCTEHPLRLRSTLAHEVGHVRLGTVDRPLDHSNWDERTPEEIQADAFARHLLFPLTAATVAAKGQEPTMGLLSNLVQRYMASPQIVAIQLRTVGAIDAVTCERWGRTTGRQLASQFGWHAEYEAHAALSREPRAPQALLARAVEGYRWGLISAATLARLDGKSDPASVADELNQHGVRPIDDFDLPARRPENSGASLTGEELARLMSDTD
ncbi:ImmA/IrrE family metallo-endopeptidase [Glutamicibacter soli]|uniref:ImmA/IrrE family metallo-endopeptidase n=1 Tax=Glutamicibacter soli TaxID=453836 RepID=UPI003FD11587